MSLSEGLYPSVEKLCHISMQLCSMFQCISFCLNLSTRLDICIIFIFEVVLTHGRKNAHTVFIFEVFPTHRKGNVHIVFFSIVFISKKYIFYC